MKTIVLSIGQFVLNIFTLVGILASVGLGYFVNSVFAAKLEDPNQALLIGVGTGLLILAFVVSFTFVAYLFIDIKDQLKKQNKLLDSNIEQ